MRPLMLAAACLFACTEVIDHTPANLCAVDNDCVCNEDCYVPDGGDLAACGARIHRSCTGPQDCVGDDAGQRCLHLVRDAGACNYTQCQP